MEVFGGAARLREDEVGEEDGEGLGVFAYAAADGEDVGEGNAVADQGGRDVEETAADVDDLAAVGGEVAEVEGGGEVLRGRLVAEVVGEFLGERRTGTSSVGSPRPSSSPTSRPWSKASASSAMPLSVWPRSSSAEIVRSRARWVSSYQAIRPSRRGGGISLRSR